MSGRGHQNDRGRGGGHGSSSNQPKPTDQPKPTGAARSNNPSNTSSAATKKLVVGASNISGSSPVVQHNQTAETDNATLGYPINKGTAKEPDFSSPLVADGDPAVAMEGRRGLTSMMDSKDQTSSYFSLSTTGDRKYTWAQIKMTIYTAVVPGHFTWQDLALMFGHYFLMSRLVTPEACEAAWMEMNTKSEEGQLAQPWELFIEWVKKERLRPDGEWRDYKKTMEYWRLEAKEVAITELRKFGIGIRTTIVIGIHHEGLSHIQVANMLNQMISEVATIRNIDQSLWVWGRTSGMRGLQGIGAYDDCKDVTVKKILADDVGLIYHWSSGCRDPVFERGTDKLWPECRDGMITIGRFQECFDHTTKKQADGTEVIIKKVPTADKNRYKAYVRDFLYSPLEDDSSIVSSMTATPEASVAVSDGPKTASTKSGESPTGQPRARDNYSTVSGSKPGQKPSVDKNLKTDRYAVANKEVEAAKAGRKR